MHSTTNYNEVTWALCQLTSRCNEAGLFTREIQIYLYVPLQQTNLSKTNIIATISIKYKSFIT